jgi:hypothetical protein
MPVAAFRDRAPVEPRVTAAVLRVMAALVVSVRGTAAVTLPLMSMPPE